MKKSTYLITSSLAASAILLSSSAFAAQKTNQTEFGISVGSAVVGEAVDTADGFDAFSVDDAVTFTAKHNLNRDVYLEGKYAKLDADSGDKDTPKNGTLDELNQLELGLGLTIDTGNSIFNQVHVGAGYFKHGYEFEAADDTNAEGFYLKTGVDMKTAVKGLTVGGEYTYYSGTFRDEDDSDYKYGVATVKADYKVNSAVSLTAAADFADSESAARVGISYGF